MSYTPSKYRVGARGSCSVGESLAIRDRVLREALREYGNGVTRGEVVEDDVVEREKHTSEDLQE